MVVILLLLLFAKSFCEEKVQIKPVFNDLHTVYIAYIFTIYFTSNLFPSVQWKYGLFGCSKTSFKKPLQFCDHRASCVFAVVCYLLPFSFAAAYGILNSLCQSSAETKVPPSPRWTARLAGSVPAPHSACRYWLSGARTQLSTALASSSVAGMASGFSG